MQQRGPGSINCEPGWYLSAREQEGEQESTPLLPPAPLGDVCEGTGGWAGPGGCLGQELRERSWV